MLFSFFLQWNCFFSLVICCLVSSAFLLMAFTADSNDGVFFLVSSSNVKNLSSNSLIIFWTSCIFPWISFISDSTIQFCWSFRCCCFLPLFSCKWILYLSSIFNMLLYFVNMSREWDDKFVKENCDICERKINFQKVVIFDQVAGLNCQFFHIFRKTFFI